VIEMKPQLARLAIRPDIKLTVCGGVLKDILGATYP